MAKYQSSLVAQNTSVFLCDVTRPHDETYWYASIFAGGTGTTDFGGGTVTIQASIDGGTTKITVNNMAGTAASFTAAGMLNIALGGPGNNIAADQLKLYATIATATNPVVPVTVYDNR